MDLGEKISYWCLSAEKDWRVTGHLFEKDDYSYALFFGHLTLEKILKALYVQVNGSNPPRSHRLVYLAEKSNLELTDEQIELLEIVTDFNLEARYPDEKFLFYKRCTKKFTKQYLDQIEEMKTWLLQKVQS
ncbi:MAG: HEPN domain-containing protein [Desulfoplanes sp.]